MDEALIKRIAELEWANYAATLGTAQVTPGLDVILRDDVIITGSEIFPTPDTNHACLLRSSPAAADELIAEVTDYFQSKGLPATIYLSPACTPADLPQRLLEQGFVRQKEREAWLVLDDLPNFKFPSRTSEIAVRPITEEEALTFAEVFMTSFGMPLDFAPQMAQLLRPSIGQPGVYHYIAWHDERPVGVCSLLWYETFGVWGSAGVAPGHRRRGAITNLGIETITEAREQGVETLMLQTTAGTLLERLLRINGFKKVFTRTCYTLSNEHTG